MARSSKAESSSGPLDEGLTPSANLGKRLGLLFLLFLPVWLVLVFFGVRLGGTTRDMIIGLSVLAALFLPFYAGVRILLSPKWRKADANRMTRILAWVVLFGAWVGLWVLVIDLAYATPVGPVL